MKKAFCFSFIVMFLALAGFTPVRADDITVVTPYVDTPTLSQSEIDQYTYSTMLMEYLRQGGTIDVKNKSDNYSSYDLIEDFGNFVEDIIGVVSDVINPFQSEFQWGKGYPLNKATPATLQMMGLLPFYALNTDGDTPQPTPDENYLSYLNAINGSGFWFKDFPNRDGFNMTPALIYYPPASVSWYCMQHDWGSVGLSGKNYYCGCYNILDVNIVHDNDLYFIDLNLNNPLKTFVLAGDTNNVNSYGVVSLYNGGQFDTMGSNANDYTIHEQYSNESLTNVLTYVYNTFKNVNVYVDGVLWSYAGNNTSYNIQLSTSTVTPSGERVRWMYDKEIYVDMDKIVEKLDEILDAIDNIPNTPTVIKFDDLDDVIVDVNGQPAIAVKVLQDDRNIDELYLATYGPIIPAFLPLFTPVIDDVDIITIADTAVSPIPEDLLEVFGYMFMGVLFVGFIHRLLE